MKKENCLRYAGMYEISYNSFIKFNKHLDIPFSDIDVAWLKRYEAWGKSQNLSVSTISTRIRHLRAVFNLALLEHAIKSDCYIHSISTRFPNWTEQPQPLTETLCSSKEIHQLLIKRIFDEETIGYKETFKVLLMNQANKLIGYTTISEDGLTSTVVDVRVVMQTALVSNATTIVIAHNHPSGNARPSGQGDSLTRKIK